MMEPWNIGETRPSMGLSSSSYGGVRSLALDPLFNNPRLIRQSLVGVIVSEGPEGEADYTDARYWVREVIEHSGGKTEEDTRKRPKWKRLADFGDPEEPFPAKWITAYNLTEGSINPGSNAEDETHDLAVGGVTLVHVFAVESPARTLHHYFVSGGKGGGGENTAFAVVTKTGVAPGYEPEDIKTTVVQANANAGGTLTLARTEEGLLDEKAVWTWPGTRAKHYTAYKWNMETITEATPILPVIRIGGKFYVQQYNRYSLQPRPLNVRTTDCGQS